MAEKVLIVEDSPTQLEALRSLLERAGFEVDAARSGEEAYEAALRIRPALVVSDVVMPGMSGLELCRRIKDALSDEQVAVVLLTSLNDPRDVVRGLSSGADSYITKPYEPADVVARVRAVLENRALRQERGGPSTGDDGGLRVRFMGEDFMLQADPEQMLGMLLGSFEELARTNRALRSSQEALAAAAARELEREQAMRAEAERSAATMERLAREAEAATHARDEVLAMVSHDLKNPLGIIYTSAALLLEVELNEEMRERQLQVIRRTAERMDRLIQDLLDVSRMEADRFRVEPKPIAVGELLDDARDTLAPLAVGRSLEVAELDGLRATRVVADAERVQRVLSNLVGNAIKFTPEGGTITLHARQNGDAVEFAVQDQGPGIPPEDLDRIFDRFWQAGTNRTGGAGLGLAIARGIVEAHGGRIWAESEPPDGATFFFTLPVASEEVGASDGDDNAAADD